MLNIHEYPGPSNQTPLLIVHGLFGLARNWSSIAKRLSAARPVYAVDMRNHGDSPWMPTNSYADMANDLAEVIASIGKPIDILGHSMGGKAAMMLALLHPYLVKHLIVGDIAPVAYSHSHIGLVQAMQSVDLEKVAMRRDADDLLAKNVEDRSTRAFLLQSLDLQSRRWRLNLKVLAAEMPSIIGWPDLDLVFKGPTLFIAGGNSNYVSKDSQEAISHAFPNAQTVVIKDAGHWLHVDNPDRLIHIVDTFLSS
jgi:esterase